MKSWYLENVESKAKEWPETFFIPSHEERSNKKPGELVRLHFALRDPRPEQPKAERMWVEVTECTANNGLITYSGRLANQPVCILDLNLGDLVEFEVAHIAQDQISKDQPKWLEIGELKAMVSAKVLETGHRTLWAYRESPESTQDSGWRLFVGDESDEYVDDVSNIKLCNVGWLVDRDPTLLRIFLEPIGSAFERSTQDNEWMTVKHWT